MARSPRPAPSCTRCRSSGRWTPTASRGSCRSARRRGTVHERPAGRLRRSARSHPAQEVSIRARARVLRRPRAAQCRGGDVHDAGLQRTRTTHPWPGVVTHAAAARDWRPGSSAPATGRVGTRFSYRVTATGRGSSGASLRPPVRAPAVEARADPGCRGRSATAGAPCRDYRQRPSRARRSASASGVPAAAASAAAARERGRPGPRRPAHGACRPCRAAACAAKAQRVYCCRRLLDSTADGARRTARATTPARVEARVFARWFESGRFHPEPAGTRKRTTRSRSRRRTSPARCTWGTRSTARSRTR